MPQVFYLDTARLGQISPSAKRALNGALEFNKVYGASAYFDDLLFGGASSLNDAHEFDGLDFWQGVGRFKNEIKRQLFGSDDGEIVFANRTASLMSLAAKMLFARCRNVLVTDLNWDSYSRILESSIPNGGCQVTEIKIRDRIFNCGASAEEITQLILEAYCRHECDGLFLPALCNHGIRLPVSSIVKSIRARAKLRFSVVDAAQAINQVDISWARQTVDFIFGGSHKWLQAYEPMAIGYYGLPSSFSFVSDTIIRELEHNPIADPLMRISHSAACQVEETVNLCPLFAAAGALHDAKDQTYGMFDNQTRAVVKAMAIGNGWECSTPSPDFQSRILMLRKPLLRNAEAGIIRGALGRMGVAVTDYRGGLCRISLPQTINEDQAAKLDNALAKVAYPFIPPAFLFRPSVGRIC